MKITRISTMSGKQDARFNTNHEEDLSHHSRTHVSMGPSDHREKIFQVKQSHFALPSVTVSSDPKRAREKRERERRWCTSGRLFRWTVIAFVIVYCKEISSFMNKIVPQTVVSAPHIRRDYSSIKGIHDLSAANVRPKCFVSSAASSN